MSFSTYSSASAQRLEAQPLPPASCAFNPLLAATRGLSSRHAQLASGAGDGALPAPR